MNKKGSMILPSETLKMVLGVISVLFLAFFLATIYFSVSGKQKEVQGAATLERIGEIFSNAKTNSSFVSEEITNINPSGWKIFIFTGPESKPQQCANGNCLCLCDIVDIKIADRQLKECSKDGLCLLEPQLKETIDIEIKKLKEGSTSIRIEKKNGGLEVLEI